MEHYSKVVTSIRFHNYEKYAELIDETNTNHWVEIKRKAYNYDKERYYNEACLTWVDDIDNIHNITEDENGHCAFSVYDENREHTFRYVAMESKEEFERVLNSTYIMSSDDN